MESFDVAAIQLQAGSDKAANLALALAAVGQAADAGAQLVALPEVFLWRGAAERERAEAETIPGPSTDALARLARERRIHVVGGSILERSDEEERPFNTATLFGPDGALLLRYRKIHLFDVDLPGRVTVRESASRAPGNESAVATTSLGRIGLAVCYDLRFPELFRRLAEAGAEVVVIPSAFTHPTGSAHWEVLARARAIENQCFFVAPNQCGRSALGFADYGNSLVVDPWGDVLARAGGDRGETIRAHLDASRLATVRSELPSLRHRRLAC